jgi:arginine exporter protein ArgO
MNAAVVSGLLAGYGIAIPVGAIAIFLIRLGATACLCIGAAAGLGAATVDGGFALAAVSGGTGLARQVQAVAGPAHWAAGALLAMVAAWMAAAAARRYRSQAAPSPVALALRTPLRAYTALAAVTVVNPLTMLYWAALVLGHQASATAFTPAHAAAFVAAVTAASASWQLILVSGGKLIGRLATSRRGTLAVSLASSLLIAAIAIQILTH